MAVLAHQSNLIKELIDAGVIPQQTVCFELIAAVGKTVKLRTTVHASQEQYEAILRAISRRRDELEIEVHRRDP